MLTGFELFFNLCMSANLLLDPSMTGNIFDLEALRRLKGNHTLEELFEVIAEESYWSLSWMSLPEDIILLFLQNFIVWIGKSSFLKWGISSIHDEENDSCSEDVNILTLILFSRDLWSHITFSSKFCSQYSCSIFALEEGREAEISNLQYKKLRKKKVLRFNISMSESLLMHIVKSVHHLMEIGPCYFFWELSSLGDKIK